jgi:hypothetical protein
VNGTSFEQNNIATQLIAALNENDLNPLLLSVRCLSEIIEETNLTTQIKMMSVLSRRLQELTYNLSWKEESSADIIRYIAKIYRQIVSKASECQLADETSIPPGEMEILMGSFAPWIEIVILKLSDNFQHTEEIFSNLSLLLEIMKFLSMAYDNFPYLCEVTDGTSLIAVTTMSWKYLFNLIEIKHLNPEELRGFETTSADGDRISVDIFVIVLFELLQICLSSRDTSSGNGNEFIDLNDLMNLIRVLMRYVQLSSDQLEQAHCNGNEFIAAEDDETLELSVRHTGKIFLKNLVSQTSLKNLMDSLFQILESDLTELQQLLAPLASHLYSSESLTIDLILKIEAMMFALSAIGRPVIKAYLRSMKGEMSVSTTPAIIKKSRSRHGKKGDTITDGHAMRLSQIIGTFVELFYQYPSQTQAFSQQELRCFMSLSVVRGAISKLLTTYCPLLVEYLPFQSLISTCLHFSLLPSTDQPIGHHREFSEPLSSKLLHCRAYGEMMRIAAKSHGPLSITHLNPNENALQIALQSCIELSPLCNESTIHIPLEIITNLLRIITQSVEIDLKSLQMNPASQMTPLPNAGIIDSLGRIGTTVWSIYCFDPFALEMAKEMLGALVHVCSYGADSLTAFLQQFLPPMDHLIGELVGNQSSKTISDLSVKLLVEGISRTSPSSPYSPEASHRISLPAIQAIIRIMHFSTDVDGLVDVGETLRAVIILFSSKHFNAQHLPTDLIDELVRETLLCIRTIFTKLMDYNYSCAVGCLCQLIIYFPHHLGGDGEMGRPRGGSESNIRRGCYQEYIQQIIHIIVSLGHASNHRNILIMGLVHIFNKNPFLIAESLGHMQLTGTNETALQYLLEVWFDLHPLVESPYHLSVSAHGLMELIRMYSAQGISSGFLIRVLRLLLETLSSVISHEIQTAQEVSVLDF